METKELLNIAMRSGEILIRSGAEVYRVEETIKRIFRSYGQECECFVLLSGIFISTEDDRGEVVSTLRQIKGHTVDLHQVERVNSFSRSLEQNRVSYKEAMHTLADIDRTPRYPFWVRLVVAGVTAFVYTLLFRGSLREAVIAAVASCLIYGVKEMLSELGFFQFFEFFVSGMIAGGISLIALHFYPGLNIYKLIIGAIMILVPGVAMTNGIKDALYGDIVSSLYRLAEAVFISVAVGAGVGVVLSLGLRWV